MAEKLISELLQAPCRICDYNGQGYWQPLTHKKYCPMYQIGGREERIMFILTDWPHDAWPQQGEANDGD